MNRRNFLFLAFTSIVGGVMLKTAACAKVYVTEGKLGYKKQSNSIRKCKKCKHFEARKEDGICKLPAMKNLMKSKEVYVLPEATCSMWMQK